MNQNKEQKEQEQKSLERKRREEIHLRITQGYHDPIWGFKLTKSNKEFDLYFR